MSLTSEQIAEFFSKANGVRDLAATYDQEEVAQLSNAATAGEIHITGAGTDTPIDGGNGFIIVMLGDKV